MTQQTVPNGPIARGDIALTGTVLTAADMARLGGELARAGFGDQQIQLVMSEITAAVEQAAAIASQTVALKMLNIVSGLVQNTHNAAAMEVYRRITNKTGGWGGLTHRNCADIAWQVAQSIPRQAPPPATTTRGPVL